MNPLDFEKTQLFAQKAKEAAPPPPSFTPPPIPSMPKATIKPSAKKLTKEEKILLATGGVLTLGLGAIVFVNLSEDAPPPPPVVNEVPQVVEAPVIEIEQKEVPKDNPTIAEFKPQIPSPKPTPRPQIEEKSHSFIDVPNEAEVSTKVDDEMSFEEAFKTARAEVGPGGLFVWNDTYYGTYSESEWESLPDNKKEQWLKMVEPIIDPVEPEPAAVTSDSHIVIAERGEIMWTGIDKNEDGIAEVLTARIQGQPPIVMIDTDGDGKLDTRYTLDSATGAVYSSAIEKTAMSMTDISQIPEVENGSEFQNASYVGQVPADTSDLPVSIIEKEGGYIVGLDLDKDALVDVITLNQDGKNTFVAMDMNSDGQVETAFMYDEEQQNIVSNEMQPMESMTVSEYNSSHEEVTEEEIEAQDMDDDQENNDTMSSQNEEISDPYFDNDSDAANDFLG